MLSSKINKNAVKVPERQDSQSWNSLRNSSPGLGVAIEGALPLDRTLSNTSQSGTNHSRRHPKQLTLYAPEGRYAANSVRRKGQGNWIRSHRQMAHVDHTNKLTQLLIYVNKTQTQHNKSISFFNFDWVSACTHLFASVEGISEDVWTKMYMLKP